MIDETVGPYRVLERIGGGGMGVVFRALDVRLGREVALKFLPPELARDATAKERLTREARAASALDHPNICTVYEIGETADERLYIALAFYRGESLKQRLERGPMGVREALDVALGIARGLARAHAAGIVHRDVKPANVMLTAGGEVKILDFGIAKVVGEATGHLTSTGSTIGTVAYMSPEQARGDEVDARTDVWSLGVVLYQMLGGELPFRGARDPAVLHSILYEEAPPLETLRPELPPGLGGLVGRLLAKEIDRRPAAASELVPALEGLAHGDGAATDRLLRSSAPARSRSRLRTTLMAAGAALAIAATIGFAWWFGRWSSRRAPVAVHSVAVLPFANLTGDRGKQDLCDALSAGVVGELAAIPGLQVAAPQEEAVSGGVGERSHAIASSLGVDATLEAQVLALDGSLRVQARLTSVRTGFVVWSRSFESGPREIERLPGRIATALARQLAPDAARTAIGSEGGGTRSPEAYDLYVRASELLEEAGDPRNAALASGLSRQAIALDPGFALAHVTLSESLLAEPGADGDRLAEAERQSRRALALAPDLPAARLALARVERARGDLAESAAELERLLAAEPEEVQVHRELAATYEELGEYDRAEQTVRRALDVRPGFWRLWSSLGEILATRGDLIAALAACRRAVDLAPDGSTAAREGLAAVQLAAGDFAAVLATLDALPRPLHRPEPARATGLASLYLGRLEAARESLALAVRLAPSDAASWLALAAADRRLEAPERMRADLVRARALAEAALAIRPDDLGHRLERAESLAGLGECESAVREAESLTEAAAGPHALGTAAAILATCDRRAESFALLRRALAAGYPAWHARLEEPFQRLREEPGFAAVVGAGE